jgi:hypothetical protein
VRCWRSPAIGAASPRPLLRAHRSVHGRPTCPARTHDPSTRNAHRARYRLPRHARNHARSKSDRGATRHDRSSSRGGACSRRSPTLALTRRAACSTLFLTGRVSVPRLDSSLPLRQAERPLSAPPLPIGIVVRRDFRIQPVDQEPGEQAARVLPPFRCASLTDPNPPSGGSSSGQLQKRPKRVGGRAVLVRTGGQLEPIARACFDPEAEARQGNPNLSSPGCCKRPTPATPLGLEAR